MSDNNKIKMFIMDVDGTLTDGKIYMGNTGELFKAFDIKDGYGVHELLPMRGVITVMMTGRSSQIVERRAKELEIVEIMQGVQDKKNALLDIIDKYGLNLKEVAYIGDDEIDIPPMKLCGVSACPNDAAKTVKDIANYKCTLNGGAGAVREFIEWLIKEDKL